eukprot:gene7406-biopygen1163
MRLLYTCFVFIADFAVTRGFVDRMEHEQARVAASTVTAERVAASLANYDLKLADELVDAAGDELPTELRAAFRALLGNLHGYRPFLPQSCLDPGTHPNLPSSWAPSTPSGGARRRRRSSGSWRSSSSVSKSTSPSRCSEEARGSLSSRETSADTIHALERSVGAHDSGKPSKVL